MRSQLGQRASAVESGSSRSFAVVLPVLCVVAALVVAACATDDSTTPTSSEALATTASSTTTTTVPDVILQAEDFKPLSEMTPVRGFFVDNALGDLDATVAVANSADGGTFPVGTVIQLVPQEAMVKRAPGFSPAIGDWEFFELDVSEEGTTIRVRGGAEVENRFGLSCAACHAQAEPQFDFVCEQDRGCDPLPIGREVIELLQDTDPRSP